MLIMIADVYAARQSYVIMFLVAMLLESNLFFTKRVIFLVKVATLYILSPVPIVVYNMSDKPFNLCMSG